MDALVLSMILALSAPAAKAAEDPATKPSAAPAPRPLTPGSMPSGAAFDRYPAVPGLSRTKDGQYEYVDPYRRYTATFRTDGTVEFADRWKRPSKKDRDNGRCCALPPQGLGALNPFTGIGMKGPLEWMLDAQGKDPLMREKSLFLARTRELRTQLAIAWTRHQLEKRLGELEDDLRKIWADRSRLLASRRQLIFELWDDCDEEFAVRPRDIPPEAVSQIDRERLKTAQVARAKIEAFVRTHLPRRSDRAYTERELGDLNGGRVSMQAFEPYRAH